MWLRLVLAVALAGGCGSGSESPRPGVSGSGSGSASAAPAATGIGPRLVEPVDAPPAGAFAEEARDPAWAPAAEAELRARLEDLPGVTKLDVECRSAQCKLTVTGDAAKTAAAIESALRGQALHLVFGEPRGGALVVYAQLPR